MPDKIDTIVLLSQSESIPFDLWHLVVSFLVEPKLKDYLVIHNQVIYVTPSIRRMTPIRLFKKKKLIPQMHHKTFGSKLQDSFIAFDLLEGRKTIQEVLVL